MSLSCLLRALGWVFGGVRPAEDLELLAARRFRKAAPSSCASSPTGGVSTLHGAPFERWGAVLHHGTMATVLLDRFLHRCTIVNIRSNRSQILMAVNTGFSTNSRRSRADSLGDAVL